MSVTPPPDFWPSPVVLNLKGVTDAVPPLYITGTTISVTPAGATTEGTVTTGAQTLAGAKNFSGSVAIGGGVAVSGISTDATLAADSDALLCTQKAVKGYVDTHGEASTATAPVYITGADVSLKNTAAATVTGISTDATLAASSDTLIPTQKAVKDYVDTHEGPATLTLPLYLNGTAGEIRNVLGATVTEVSNVSYFITPAVNTKIPTQLAMTEYTRTAIEDTAVVGATAPFRYSRPNATLSLYSDASEYVTIISNSGTMVANSSITIPTQQAVRSYVAGYSPVVAATAPLSIVARTISVAEATAAQAGVVTTVDQSFSGIKTFRSTTEFLSPVPQIYFGAELGTLSMLETAATTGNTRLTTPGTFSLVAAGGTALDATTTTLKTPLAFSAPSVSAVHQLSGTTATLASAGDGTSTLTVPAGGFLIGQGANAVLSSAGGVTRIPQTLEIGGELKLSQPAVLLTLSGPGPFNDVPLANGASLFVFDCTTVTSGAHITGFSATSYTSCRICYLIFLHPTSANVIVDHLSSSSTANARVLCYRGTNLTLRVEVQDTLQLLYDPFHMKWITMTHES
jgi:hypothetical protein